MNFRPARRQSARNWRKVLDRNWHTVQGTNGCTCAYRIVSVLGLLECLLTVDEAETVQLTVDLINSGEAVLHNFFGRNITVPDLLRQCYSRRKGEVTVSHRTESNGLL